MLFGGDLLDRLSRLALDIRLQLRNLLNVFIVSKFEQGLLVVASQLQKALLLRVLNLQQFVVLFLDLLLQSHVVASGPHEIVPQILRQQHLHDVDLLDNDAVGHEFFNKILSHGSNNLGLGVTDPMHSSVADEAANTFVDFLREELLQPVGAEVVEELACVFLPNFGLFVFIFFSEDLAA